MDSFVAESSASQSVSLPNTADSGRKREGTQHFLQRHLRSLHPSPDQLRRFRLLAKNFAKRESMVIQADLFALCLASPVQRTNHFPGSYHLGRKDWIRGMPGVCG